MKMKFLRCSINDDYSNGWNGVDIADHLKMTSGCRSGNGGSPSGCGEYMFFLGMQMCFTHVNMSKNDFAGNTTRH